MPASVIDLEEARRAREARYAAMRRREIAYGRWAPVTEAERVREHVLRLRESMTLGQIVEATLAAGTPVGTATINALLNGRRSGSAPSARIRRSTACALLAVTAPDERARRVRQLRTLARVLTDVGLTPHELRHLSPGSLAGLSATELDQQLVQALELAVLELERALAPTPAPRRTAAAYLLRKVFALPLRPAERGLVAAALCGPVVGMTSQEAAALVRVTRRTVQRDLAGQRSSTASTATIATPSTAATA